jgi:hypothetical protein
MSVPGALACLRLVLQSLCDFFTPSVTLLTSLTGPHRGKSLSDERSRKKLPFCLPIASTRIVHLFSIPRVYLCSLRAPQNGSDARFTLLLVNRSDTWTYQLIQVLYALQDFIASQHCLDAI